MREGGEAMQERVVCQNKKERGERAALLDPPQDVNPDTRQTPKEGETLTSERAALTNLRSQGGKPA